MGSVATRILRGLLCFFGRSSGGGCRDYWKEAVCVREYFLGNEMSKGRKLYVYEDLCTFIVEYICIYIYIFIFLFVEMK